MTANKRDGQLTEEWELSYIHTGYYYILSAMNEFMSCICYVFSEAKVHGKNGWDQKNVPLY
jgi:hypothetical protein